MNKSKNKFTLKIVISYLVLICLALVSGYFIFSEIKVFLSTENAVENDTKLLKTGMLLTNIYEAESLSKLALQSKTKKNFNAYGKKVDSIFIEIDTLKRITQTDYQRELLDSVVRLLEKKVANNNEFYNLRAKNEANSTIDNALKEFSTLEASMGKITPESLVPDFFNLPLKSQNTLREYVAYLNKNVPNEGKQITNAEKVDSLLDATKLLLINAKTKDLATQRTLSQKEITITQNDIQLSQQLQSIVSSFEQEVIINNYNTNVRKEAALKTSLRLAQIASILGFLIVGVFTFLITKDYWGVQTYREHLENEKKYSESLLKSREQLISTVSHDLRTPLNTITGYSELMENTTLVGKQADYLKHVKSAAQYVHNLVNDLLDFSKLEAGKIKIENVPFILSHLIVETAENLKEIHRNKPIELRLDLDKKLEAAVLGDPFRIRQILNNLIGNAYKFTHQGSITIEAKVDREVKGNYITIIKVMDSGVGIEKEKQEDIFKEFTQADEKTEKKYGGYGLGLTISKKLVELIKGTISVASEQNKGSVFTVCLPLTISKNSIVATSPEKILPKKGLTILILDDDPSMLRLLKEVCNIENIIAHAYSDFNAISPQMDLAYDVVLTDIQMPTISGFDVLKALQTSAYSHYGNQPVIAMTGRKDLKIEAYTEAGFAKILQKPFTKTAFMEVLGALFPATMPTTKKQPVNGFAKSQSHLFSLEVISSFLGEDMESINEVLQTFVNETEKNIELLQSALETGNDTDIRNIAHRMLPMFRQLKANDLVPILEKLEDIPAVDVMDKKALKVIFMQLKQRTTALLLALNAHLVTHPDYKS